MNNLYFVPFYYDEKKSTSVNLDKIKKRLTTYLMNCCVALLSARVQNPNVDIFLVTNLEKIDYKFSSLLNSYNIKIVCCKYNSFVFPDNFKWSAAFYKLCALKFIIDNYGNLYSNILYTDSDVFCQRSFQTIWEECQKDKILLFDLAESSNNSLYKKFCLEFMSVTGKDNLPIHYGGEFFAANINNARSFLGKLFIFYHTIVEKNIIFDSGDELILSLAADNNLHVKNASPFIFRYWTDSFRIISTRYLFNPLVFLHCPDQKERGFIFLFKFYFKNKKFPKFRKIYSILKLSHSSFKTKIINLSSIFLKKYRISHLDE